MVTFDQHKNFAYSTVLTPPNSGGNSNYQLTVQSGNGALFPNPASGEYNLVVWSSGANPTVSNATIVRVTALSSDTFTFVRTQEGTNDRTILSGDQVALAPTAKVYTDIETGFNNLNFFNVLDYGAVGNGTTDDTTAIQNAINAANSAGGGIVLFPPKTFKLTSNLTTYTAVQLIGESPESTILTQSNGSYDAIDATDASSIIIRNMLIGGPSTGTSSGVYLAWSSAGNIPYLKMDKVIIKNFGSDGINVATPIVSTFDTVVCQGNGRYGFNLVQGGTSTTFRNCWARSNLTAGYRLYQSAYIDFIGCAADSNGIGYLIDSCTGITMAGIGLEGQTSYGVEITNSNVISVTSAWCYHNNSLGLWVTGGSQNVDIKGAYDTSPLSGAVNFLKIDSGCNATISGIHNVTANSLAAGTTNILNDGGGGIVFQGSFTGHITSVADTAYSIAAGDYIVAYTSLTTARTVTLPTAASVAGKVYIVKDASGNAGTHTITVATTSSQTIDGSSTLAISSSYGKATVYSDGSNWFTIY